MKSITDIQNLKQNITKYYESKPFTQKRTVVEKRNTIKVESKVYTKYSKILIVNNWNMSG